MRIWDLKPNCLCCQHLLAEHRELHGLWNILTKHGGRDGYSRHPETLRWVGKTKALYNRHEALVAEFFRRGYRHLSPLDRSLARGKATQDVLINTIAEQKQRLRDKKCACQINLKP